MVWTVLLLLLACSALFSAGETALFSLEERDLDRAGPLARRLRENPQGLLITILFGNLLVNVLLFATAASLPVDAGEFALGLGALLAVLVFGEILPKSTALRAPVAVARAAALPLTLFVAVLAPARAFVRVLLDIGLRALGDLAREEPRITPESLAEVLEGSAGHGLIAPAEADLLAEVIELEGIRVGEIMTPRVDMLALDLRADEDDNIQIIARALARRMTWLPVVRRARDDVAGAVRLRDILSQPDASLADLVRPVLFVPEVASALDLLRLLRERQATEAVVVDEWGGTAGAVTIESIFEEIVGDLRVEGEKDELPVLALGGGRFRVFGGLSIRDWNERFGSEVVPEGFETVGGFVAARLGRIPRAGDRVRAGGLVTEVREVRGRRVHSVDIFVEGAEDRS